ncbi:MAG: hypothetical protein WD066_17725 [Planctomycetaceae bacterium]
MMSYERVVAELQALYRRGHHKIDRDEFYRLAGPDWESVAERLIAERALHPTVGDFRIWPAILNAIGMNDPEAVRVERAWDSLETWERLHNALGSYLAERPTSIDPDRRPEPVTAGHYVHDAVRSVEALMLDGKLPVGGTVLWREFLAATRGGDWNAVERAGMEFQDWANLQRSRAGEAIDGRMPVEAGNAKPDEFVLVSELWPNRTEFKWAYQVTRFLNKTPEIQSIQRGRRRYVREADWHRYFREKDRQASESLDDEALQEKLADIEARKAEEQAKKPRK